MGMKAQIPKCMGRYWSVKYRVINAYGEKEERSY